MKMRSRTIALAVVVLVSLTAVAFAQELDDVSVRKATIWSEGTRMAAQIFSPRAAAEQKLPTIIMAHGWGGTAAMLRADALAFAKAGYLVVAFDYRGWGDSDARVILTGPAPA
jgi:uncharacterized protein